MTLEELIEKYANYGEKFALTVVGQCYEFVSNSHVSSASSLSELVNKVSNLPIICYRQSVDLNVQAVRLYGSTPNNFIVAGFNFVISNATVTHKRESWMFNPGDWLVVAHEPLGVMSNVMFEALFGNAE